MLILFI